MEKIKTYKAFDKELKCRDFQYEIGKEYKHKGKVEICSSGFHSCINPFDCLSYYPLIETRFCECEVWGKTDKNNDDSKVSSEFILIVKELSEKEFNLICVDFLIKECEEKQSGDDSQQSQSGYASKQSQSGYRSQQSQSGDDSQQSQSGDDSQQSQSGDRSQQSQSGDHSKQSQSGYRSKQSQSGYASKQSQSGYRSQQSQSGDDSQQSQSGDRSQQSQSGDHSKQSQSGYRSKQSQSGYRSKQSQSGDDSQQCSCGYDSEIIATGENNVAAAIGEKSKIKGIIGTWITLAEYDNDSKCICVKSAIIDGKKLLPDTWYILKNKKFTAI